MLELTLSDYIIKAKKIESNFGKSIKLAILSSFTVNGLKEVLTVKCGEIKVSAEIYVAGYNQYRQELLDDNSNLYKFKPEIVYLLLDTRSILSELFFLPYQVNHQSRKKYISQQLKEIFSLVDGFTKKSDSKLVVTNLSLPTYSPLGIADEKVEFSLNDAVTYFNDGIKSRYLADDQVFVYDFNSFANRFGENNIFDPKMYYLGDIKISPDYLPYLVENFVSYVKVALSLNRKCIVLDLDNTLWGGIVGEDGFDGIQLSPQPPGNVYYEFQKYLLALFQKGIILAINSKNNEADAMKVIRDHPYMILRPDNFAAFRINWQDKVKNMEEIAQELNIGLDSLVYFDDDPINREMIKKYLPEVKVIDLPRDPSLYVRSLQSLNDFDTFQVTMEDQKRGKMYIDERQRREFQSEFSNLDDFLKSLNIKVTIKPGDSFTTPRISQLTLKTNQFNLTTRRYTEEDIKKFIGSDDHLVYSVQVEDKFGDQGIVGVIIINCEKEWQIDTFLLSCRVIGRNIEKVMLDFIINVAKKKQAKRIIGQYVATEKNKPCVGLYQDNGFQKNEDGLFVFDLLNNFFGPDYIKLID